MLIDIHSHNYSNADIAVINSYPYEKLKDIKPFDIRSCGIHPWHIHNCDIDECIKTLSNYCDKKVIQVIGECGLDKNVENIDLQMEVFKRQIELSEQYGFPIIIHSVKTHHLILELRNNIKSNLPWLIHGYTGSVQTAQQFTMQNIFISFGKFLWQQPEKSRKLLNEIDENFIFFETDDSDYQIEQVYNQAASLLNMPIANLEQVIHSNFKRFFT